MVEFRIKFLTARSLSKRLMVDWTGRMSSSVLFSIRRTHTVDDCAMYCADWNGLQRHRQNVQVWVDGTEEEDQWKARLAPRKGLVPNTVRGVCASRRVKVTCE